MFKDNMFGSLIFFAIYFSEKNADGGSSKGFLLPVILVVIVVLIFAVIGMYLTWKKEKFSFCRKKGNIMIDVDVIYRGFISFSGHEYNSIQEYIYPRKMFLSIHLMSRYTVHMVK